LNCSVNSTLTAVDKFQYLSSLLEGPAFAAIAGLKMTTTNYIEAIDILTKRFGNKSKMASKTKVAPLVQATIPQLELLPCLLLARHVEEALKPVFKVQLGLCFTDFKVVLYWVHGEYKDWKPFVNNRVTEIHQLVPAINWSHCPGKDNPTDLKVFPLGNYSPTKHGPQ